jgi:TonB family protein
LPGKLQARLETLGGHIYVSDVTGDLRAVTAGGHISAGNINGDAVLRSGGGHIRAGEISGKLQIDTAGGNISVQRAGGSVNASTPGGQIDFGEASGSVRAHTGGGGIRILHVAGPIQLETNDGSICLTRVQGSVRASTGSGTITAWINPGAPRDSTVGARTGAVANGSTGPMPIPRPRPELGHIVGLSGASQLESGQGDIIVFLPRYLAVNIEATIERAADHRIETDPELPLKFISQSGTGSRWDNAIHAEGALNGGGEVLRLRTVSGNIRLKYFDSDPALHEMLIRQQRTRLDRQKKILEQRVEPARSPQEVQSAGEVSEFGRAGEWDRSGRAAPVVAPPDLPRRRNEDIEQRGERNSGLFEYLGRKLEMRMWGGVRVDPEELQNRLISTVKPQYPELAKRAGIDGAVQLEVQVNKNGTVEVRRALAGERLLVNAAIEAVKQWRYDPVIVEGKPVNAISTVVLEFRLH